MLVEIYRHMFTDKLTDVNVSAKICKGNIFLQRGKHG